MKTRIYLLFTGILMLGILATLFCVSHANAMSATVSIPENYAEVHPVRKSI